MSEIIHALSSGQVPAGIAVMRISGKDSLKLLQHLLQHQSLPPPRTAMLRSIFAAYSGQVIDRALVLLFPGPRSFTGEDLVELHLHGSIAVIAALQKELVQLGSRPALPGEFTRRAFENGQLDLVQAEALADLLAAETEMQRQQAQSASEGRLSRLAEQWRSQLVEIMADLEADLDFSDEGDVDSSRARPSLNQLATQMEQALASSPLAERLRQGLSIAIIGPPNAGKSSLLNALSRRDVAIVTPIAGTTRDLIEVHLDLAGRPATLIDTAGLRETDDPVEAEGIARARARATSADLRLLLGDNLAVEGPSLQVRTRIDLSNEQPGIHDGVAYISSVTGAGIAELEQWLADWAINVIPSGEPSLVTTERQRHLLNETASFVRLAIKQIDPVLQAEDLRSAAYALGRLTGRIGPEDVLDHIFSRFCLGK